MSLPSPFHTTTTCFCHACFRQQQPVSAIPVSNNNNVSLPSLFQTKKRVSVIPVSDNNVSLPSLFQTTTTSLCHPCFRQQQRVSAFPVSDNNNVSLPSLFQITTTSLCHPRFTQQRRVSAIPDSISCSWHP